MPGSPKHVVRGTRGGLAHGGRSESGLTAHGEGVLAEQTIRAWSREIRRDMLAALRVEAARAISRAAVISERLARSDDERVVARAGQIALGIARLAADMTAALEQLPAPIVPIQINLGQQGGPDYTLLSPERQRDLTEWMRIIREAADQKPPTADRDGHQ